MGREQAAEAIDPNRASGAEGESSRPEATEEAEKLIAADRTRFKCIRNAAYHEDRERHYVRLQKLCMFVVVLFGTAAFGAIAKRSETWALATSFISTFAGVSSLVFEFDGKARLHASLKNRMFDLLARCEVGEDCKEIDAEMTRTYGEEPPVKHGVNAVAFNAAVDAMGRPRGQKYVLQPWQILARHWWPFRANEFPTIEDQAKPSAPKSA